MIYNLVEGLVAAGHEVILFAPKESKVSCKLYPYIERDIHLGLDSSMREKVLVGEVAVKYAYAMSAYEGVDIIHDHTLSSSPINVPTVHTLHGPSNEATVKHCVELSSNPKNYFVSISERQKELYLRLNSKINFIATVHNCIDIASIPWKKEKEDFFFFAGRANWEKGLDIAVRVAAKANVNLVMAVKMSEDFEKDFFQKEIQPLINNYPKSQTLEFYEEISRELLDDLFLRAKCTLFTSQWEEPFGLVMIESMACGTPVIGIKRGAVPEVIVHGKTGFIAETEEEMVQAIKRIDEIDPGVCRRYAEENFSRKNLAQNYLAVYEKILSR